MNKQQLEKKFDESFPELWLHPSNVAVYGNICRTNAVKKFIFQTVIPEVLKSTLSISLKELDAMEEMGARKVLNQIKQKSKQLYNIDL